MMQILVLEDNLDLLDDLTLNLTHAGFQVSGVGTATQLDEFLLQQTPAIALLDLGLPGEDGLSVAQRLKRSHPQMGIIMVTARGSLDDRIVGHQLGADHYLVKPVNYQELIAVIHSLLRRLNIEEQTSNPVSEAWVVDKQALKIYPPGQTMRSEALSWAEFCLLEVFQAQEGFLATKEQLIYGLGHNPEYFDSRRLETAISRLRRKLLTLHPESDDLVRAIRNRGYQFTAPLVIKVV